MGNHINQQGVRFKKPEEMSVVKATQGGHGIQVSFDILGQKWNDENDQNKIGSSQNLAMYLLFSRRPNGK